MPIWKRKRAKRDVWIVDYRDSAGVRHRETATTKEAADNLLADKNVEARRPRLIGNPDITLAEYAKGWFTQLPSSGIKPRTVTSYHQLFDNHLDAALGPMKLRDIRRAHVKALLNAKREETRQNKAGTLERRFSRNTVRLIRACLSAMLGEAVDDELLRENPASLPSRRRGQKSVGTVTAAERQKAIRPFTDEELRKILEVAEKREAAYRPIFLLLARTGMRPGEAFALQWPDLDFTNRKILVERAFSDGELGTTKTDNVRTVDMSQELAATLSSLYKAREAQTLKEGWPEIPEFVFVNTAGNPMDERRVRKGFARAMKKAEVSGHRLYDLRHTFATALLAKSAPITYVAAQLGHSKPSTTLQFYAHWLPRPDAGFVDRLDALGSVWRQSGTNLDPAVPSTEQEAENSASLQGFFGAPSETRTRDPLIKSLRILQ